MMRKLPLLFLFLGWWACGSPKKPDGVLSQPQLAALLIDVYLAEARIGGVPISKDSSMRFFMPHEQKLLQQKGIPDSVLKKTYTYYLANPKELEQVYDAVIDTLALREKRASHGQIPSGKPGN